MLSCRLVRLIVVALVCLSASTASAAEPSPEHAKLIGKWQALTVEANGQQNQPEGDAAKEIEFTAEQILLGDQKLTYKVDTETTPKLIDLEVKIGEEANPRSLEGIYKIEEGQLTICLYFSDSGAAKRPDEFTTAEGSNRIMVVLKRLE